MIPFPPFIFYILIYGSLVLTACGLCALLILLWKDHRNRSIW